VLDSVIGAYVTQAVSDVQSSSAFINLAATWPAAPAAPAAAAAAAAAPAEGGTMHHLGAGSSGSSGPGSSGGSSGVLGAAGDLAPPPYYQKGQIGKCSVVHCISHTLSHFSVQW